MDTAVRLTGDRSSNGINDADAKRAPLQAVPHRQNGIGSLSTLAQEHADIISEDGRLPVQESLANSRETGISVSSVGKAISDDVASQIDTGAPRRIYNPTRV
jgi:hypothetical protein